MSETESYDIIIVGGGISGLSLASKMLQNGKKVLLFNEGDTLGGCLHTAKSSATDFWFEMGAHTFYNVYVKTIKLIKDNGLEDFIIERKKVKMRVFTNRLRSMMSGFSKLELLISIPKILLAKKEGETVKSYYSKILGSKNFESFFTRIFSAVIVQKADHYAADLFLKSRKTRDKSKPKSFILKGGMSQLVDKIASHANLTIHASAVKSIEKTNNGFICKAENFNSECKNIALACSPKVASKLLSNINAEISSMLSSIKMSEVESVGYSFDKQDVDIEEICFAIPLKGACYSMVTRDVFAHEQERGFVFHFKKDEFDTDQQQTFVESLLNQKIEKANTKYYKSHTLPLLELGHVDLIKTIDDKLKNTGLFISGNFFEGLSLEDCVSRSDYEFSRFMSEL